MKDAIRRAHLAICDHLCDSNELKDPPGTTIAALMAGPDRAVVGWVGDSRVYLFSPGDSRQLTHDHSWITETVDSGDMTEEQALRSPLAHAITRCLGPLDEDDPGESPEPGIVSIDLPHPCRLLVCSDGFWNDVPGASEIEELMKTAPEGADLLAACRRLVDHALQCGGRDNISVIIADFVAGSGPIAANVSGLHKREEFSNGV